MMSAEQLKGSILQLAMQGKLVEQKPEEGTGEELFKKILAEKKKLIKEGKVKKQKDLSPITEESAPFEIPESWKWANLGEIIDFRMGKTPPRAEAVYWGNDIFWVSIADMVDGKIITETKEKISHKALVERFNDQISPKGTLIMSFKLTVGRVSILGMDAVHNEAIISIFPFINTDDVLRDYLKTMLPFLSVYGESKKAIKGFTLNSASLNQIPVPLPPLAEQRRIVAKIEELMPFVEQYAVTSTKLNTLNATFPEMMKKSILQEAVQGKLVPQDPNDEPASLLLKKIAEEKKRLIKEGKIKKQKPLSEITEDEIPFDIPDNWEWARIGEITLLNPKNDLDDNLDTSFIPMTLVDDKFSNHHTSEKRKWGEIKKGFSHFAEGDIGVAKITPCFQNRKSCVFKDLINGYGAGTTELSIVRPFKQYSSQEYLLYIFKSELFISNGVKSFTGTAGQQRIHKDYLRQFVMPVPPLEEQKRIVSRVKELMKLVDNLL